MLRPQPLHHLLQLGDPGPLRLHVTALEEAVLDVGEEASCAIELGSGNTFRVGTSRHAVDDRGRV